MAIATNMASTFATLLSTHGTTYYLAYNARSYSGTEYDDEVLAQSGTTLSGTCLREPFDPYGADKHYLEQGLVQATDQKFFFPSGITLRADCDLVVSAGSYVVRGEGIREYYLEGILIYTSVFAELRK